MDQRRAFAFIFCTVTLDMLAAGLMIPVWPHLILDFMGNDTASAAKAVGVFSTVWAAMQFVSVLGVMSDRYGRRPVILISCQLQGANSSIASVAVLNGPAVFTAAFSLLLGPLPGAPFGLAALILLADLAGALWATRKPAYVRPR